MAVVAPTFTLPQLPSILDATLKGDSAVLKAAERALEQLQRLPGYLPALMQLVGPAGGTMGRRLQAAITLKNAIANNWAKVDPKEVRDADDTLFPPADKMLIRANIFEVAMVLTNKPLVSAISEAVASVAKAEMPRKAWPELIPSIQANLKRIGELGRVHNTLLCLRRIAKKFQPNHKDWAPMGVIFNTLEPMLLQMYEALIGNPSVESGTLIKLIAKTLWSCLLHNTPDFTQDKARALKWFGLMNQTLALPLYEAADGKLPCQPADLDDRPQYPWWKAKKWVAQIFMRFSSKFVDPSYFDGPSTHLKRLRKVARLWGKDIMHHVTATMLKLLYHRRNGGYLTTKVLVCILQFLGGCFEKQKQFAILRKDGNLKFLLAEVVPGLCAFNDEDQELWIDDPVEFIRRGYDFQRDFIDPRVSAISLVVDAVREQPKNALAVLWQFFGEQLEGYHNTPEPSRNHRLKDGVLHLLGSIEGELKDSRKHRLKIEALLQRYVLPEFTPSPRAPYLAARACTIMSLYADIPFKNKTIMVEATKKIIGLLGPEGPLVVQFQAAVCLDRLITSENAEVLATVGENVTGMVGNLLRLMGSLAIDDVVQALERLVENFGILMLPYAPALADKLIEVYHKNVAAEDDEDDYDQSGNSMMAADNCVTTLMALVQTTVLEPSVYPALEAKCLPLLAEVFDLESEDVNMMPLACELMQTLCFVSPSPFSNGLWAGYVAMMNAFMGFGYDFLEECVNCVQNYVQRDRSRFLRGDKATGANYLAAAWQMVDKVIVGGNEADKAVALRVICYILHNHPRAVDPVLDLTVKRALTRLLASPIKDKDLQIMVSNVIASCFLYNKDITLTLLENVGGTMAVMGQWFGALPQVQTPASSCINAMGLCALLRVGPAKLPAAIKGNLSALLLAVVKELQKVHENEEEDTASEAESEDDDAAGAGGDSSEEEDDSIYAVVETEEPEAPTTAEEEALHAAFDEVAQKSRARYVAAQEEASDDDEEEESTPSGAGAGAGAGAAADAAVDADDDDDDDDEEEEEAENDDRSTSLVQRIDELVYFADTMRMYGAIPEGAAMHAGLPPKYQKTCVRLLKAAEESRAAIDAADMPTKTGALFTP